MEALTLIVACLAAVIALLQFVNSYTKQEDEHRRRFQEFVQGWTDRLVPAAKDIAWRLVFLALAAISGIICWQAVVWVHDFSVSAEPLVRADLWRFALNAFNLISYGLATSALIGITLRRRKKGAKGSKSTGFLTLGRKEGQTIKLTLDPAQFAASGEAAEQGEIIITVSEIRRDQVKIGIEAPKTVRILRGELAN